MSWKEISARLDEFGQLSPHWDSYDAEPIAVVAVNQAREVLGFLRRSGGDQLLPLNLVPCNRSRLRGSLG